MYEKQYSECLYRALALAYEDHPLDDTLEKAAHDEMCRRLEKSGTHERN